MCKQLELGFSMFDDCIYFNLSSLTRSITEVWKGEFVKLGLSPSHGYLLFAMVEKPDAQQKDYGSCLDLDASTVNRLVDSLVGKRLVEKSGSGRGSSLSVTVEGKRLYRKIKKAMEQLKLRINEELGEARFEKLVKELAVTRELIK